MAEIHPSLLSLRDILTPNRTLYRAHEDSKKRVLELISQTAAKSSVHLDAKDVFDGLVAREKLGSTAIGHGVAIPHTRISNITAPIGVFVHLESAIPFDAMDNQAVDLFFGLLVPDNHDSQHLALLAQIAKVFHEENHRRLCREAGNDAKLYEQLIDFARQSLTS